MKKGGIALERINSREDAKDFLFSTQVIEITKMHYIKQNKTARQTIEDMKLSEWYKGNEKYFARAFSYHLPKDGKNRGGARPNAGRPVGSRMCPGCGMLRKECTCPEPPALDDAYKLLRAVSEPVDDEDGVYMAIVAIESAKGRYKVYEKKIARYPTYADIERAMVTGNKVPPEKARAYFGGQLEHKLEY